MTRVAVLPGRNLGPSVPQLLFPAFAALRRGATVDAVEWTDAEGVDGLDEAAAVAWVDAQVADRLDGVDLVIAKSLGSYAAPLVARLGVPAIWVTPLVTAQSVRDALVGARAPFLLVGGTADPLWDGVFARRATPYVLELADADHGRFAPGPLAASAANIGLLATAAERFLDEVLGLSG